MVHLIPHTTILLHRLETAKGQLAQSDLVLNICFQFRIGINLKWFFGDQKPPKKEVSRLN